VNQFKNRWGETAQRLQMFKTAIVGEYFHIYRSLWRSHLCAADNSPALLECPESCDHLSQTAEECACEITQLKDGRTTWENIWPCLVPNGDNEGFFQGFYTEEMRKDLVYMVSTNSAVQGDMLESASPADILFWMIHPVVERLLAAKRLPSVTEMAGTEFYKWETDTEKTWLEMSAYNLAAGQNLYHPEAYTCEGHAEGDRAVPEGIPLTHQMDKIADADGDGIVTNIEFYNALDPTNVNGQDYVFDNFKWDHCEDKLEFSEKKELGSIEEYINSW
jgi:hypothetical protein